MEQRFPSEGEYQQERNKRFGESNETRKTLFDDLIKTATDEGKEEVAEWLRREMDKYLPE